MFGRKKAAPKMDVVRETLGPEQTESFLPAPAGGSEMAVMQRMMGEFMASTVMARVQSDVGAIARDFREFKDNIAALNSELGVFRDKVIVPVKEELQYIRYNLGARSDDTVGSMQKLVHHLESQLNLLLKARGIDPQARDAAGETVLDRMGVPPDRPNYQELERDQLLQQIYALADHGFDERDVAVLAKIRDLTKAWAA